MWRAAVPRRLSARGRYMLSATDETNTIRFLPTYLCKCNPPRDIEDPMMVARMVNCAAARPERDGARRALPPHHPPTLPLPLATQVNCITFENDQHTVEPGQKAQKGGAQELWSNPNYFMEVKKGASEDHAILLANLFLGMGLDAYLAIGRLPGGVTQVRRAVLLPPPPPLPRHPPPPPPFHPPRHLRRSTCGS